MADQRDPDQRDPEQHRLQQRDIFPKISVTLDDSWIMERQIKTSESSRTAEDLKVMNSK